MFLSYLGLITSKDEKLFTKYHCVFKKSSTFAELLKSSAIEASFGEMAEWSIATVSNTVKPVGFEGSNPSLSAKRVEKDQRQKLSQKLKWYIFVRSGFQYHIILITITIERNNREYLNHVYNSFSLSSSK